jgi:rhodanese-related sulfurtransferase
MRRTYLLLACLLLLGVACANSSAIRDVSVDEFHDAMGKPDTFVLDVRDVVNMGEDLHFLREATQVPLASLSSNLQKVPKDRNIYLLGQRWEETVKAGNILADAKYPFIFRVKGGMPEYAKKFPPKE